MFITWFTLLMSALAPVTGDGPNPTVDLITEYWDERACVDDLENVLRIAQALEKDGLRIIDGELCVEVQR